MANHTLYKPEEVVKNTQLIFAKRKDSEEDHEDKVECKRTKK